MCRWLLKYTIVKAIGKSACASDAPSGGNKCENGNNSKTQCAVARESDHILRL